MFIHEGRMTVFVFFTNTQYVSFLLSLALPNMPFEHIILTDATLESALEFVYNHLDRDEYPDLIKSVQTIGGRLTDLELFVQKIKSGTTPDGKPFSRPFFFSAYHSFQWSPK